MVGISGQLNDSTNNKNDEALIPDTHGPMTQFINKPTNIANNNSDSQGQTEDMSAFKKFVSILDGIYFHILILYLLLIVSFQRVFKLNP